MWEFNEIVFRSRNRIFFVVSQYITPTDLLLICYFKFLKQKFMHLYMRFSIVVKDLNYTGLIKNTESSKI